MKGLFFLVLSGGIFVGTKAQSLQDGQKYIYYEQYQKAREVFKKLVAANPADDYANYWLGQSYIDDGFLDSAQMSYAKSMTTTNQSPLQMTGMGHVELLMGKNDVARQHFEAAIAATENKKNKHFGDPTVLEAIGRANADGSTQIGDPDYGIAKLQQAAQLDDKNAEIYTNIGISYLKKGGEFGGEAKRAFETALEKDPNDAYAYLRIGRIFESQKNTNVFLENYNKAISVDKAYAPAYLVLYDYYQNKDVNKAKEYLDQYVANVPKDKETDFLLADFLYRTGKYQESLSKVKEIESGLNGEPFPKIYKLFALNYDKLGDSVNAKSTMESYFTRQMPSKITGDDYLTLAELNAKFPGNEAKADEYFNKAVDADTTMENKLTIINQIATIYDRNKNYGGELSWLNKALGMKAKPTALDYYNAGNAGVLALSDSAIADSTTRLQYFNTTDTIYQRYVAAYPDQPQPYYYRSKAAKLYDSDTSKGTALESIDAYTAYMKNDTAKYKNTIIQNYGYKVYYYVNKVKDYRKALEAVDSILAIDPENVYAKGAKSQLEKVINSKDNPDPSSPGKKSGKAGEMVKPDKGMETPAGHSSGGTKTTTSGK